MAYQALQSAIGFSTLFQQTSFSGIITRPFVYLPKFCTVLIAEEEQNKVGIYNARTLNFLSWMINPDVTKGTRFLLPLQFFVLKNEFVIVLERLQMHILNEDCVPVQESIKGEFLSMSEGPEGGLLLIELPESNSTKLTTKKLLLCEGKYCL